ncbi:hypothetical protein BGZ60DRAFT_394378 [Tricladium varicosporioides]|nr:hypothetical protein BGZ60DRAFT_394378 [Hymenoscyphus varicosporioides]
MLYHKNQDKVNISTIMFEFNQQSLPVLRTRKALLLLDLQNDFISTGGLLEVEEPPHLVEKILELLPYFRAQGNDVIWVRSWFEASRSVNQVNGESVITDEQIQLVHRRSGDRNRPRPSERLRMQHNKIATANGREPGHSNDFLEADDNEDEEQEIVEETFLTIPPGKNPRVVAANSPGLHISPLVASGIDPNRDLVFQKSYYSAFKDGKLMQVMRKKFITEIYLCGALTNISVFATAMDAARHGYAITILQDCVGYRSKARHDEALRQLTESTGCDIINSEELIGGSQSKEKTSSRPPSHDPPRREKGADLESMMARMTLRRAGAPRQAAKEEAPAQPVNGKVAESVESGGSVDSLEPDEKGVQKATIEVDGKKRERVKSKVKTRRRYSKPLPAEGSEPRPATGRSISPTSATLRGASQALESTSREQRRESQPSPKISSPDSTALNQVTAATNDNQVTSRSTDSETDLSPPSQDNMKSNLNDLSAICEGDTSVVKNLLKGDLADGIFEKIRDEVRWQKMSHQGGDVPRLVAIQGFVGEDGSIPIYRHPADESPPLLPFSPTVSLIQKEVEKKLGHTINHVLIQFYRDGTDYISEHSDKTLDIVPNTFIANVSLGAQRTMVFRTKKSLKNDGDTNPQPIQPRQSVRAPLPHNSLCKVGLKTNMIWLHAIRQDKRMRSEKSPEELVYNEGRISLTFRLIGTFLDKDERKIWGQGATAKSKKDAKSVINGETSEAELMIRAFGKENHSSEFDWKAAYGQGFDVLHISNSRKLFLSGDEVANLKVKLSLAEHGITWVEGHLSPSFNWKDGGPSKVAAATLSNSLVKFVDNDLSKSTITGDLAIMLYLQSVYGNRSTVGMISPPDFARQFTRFQQSGELLKRWRATPFSMKPFRKELEMWEAYATESTFIAGSTVSLADFALWPILHEIYGEWPDLGGFEKLCAYYERMNELDSVKSIDGKGKLIKKAL